MRTDTYRQSQTLASRLKQWFTRAWEATTETDVIGRLDDQTLNELARDCGISSDQLKQLANAGPHAADEMIALMLAISIDPTEVSRLYPTQFRDMQVNCSLCESKERCRHDLATQVAEREHIHYCSNADHLTSLQREAPLLMA